jgi:glutaredoxin-like protein
MKQSLRHQKIIELVKLKGYASTEELVIELEVSPYCAKAKQLLRDKGLSFEEIVLGQDATIVSVRAVSGRATVPQVFIGGKHIGGSDDLEKYFA